jgi:hypothetical protein
MALVKATLHPVAESGQCRETQGKLRTAQPSSLTACCAVAVACSVSQH